MSGKYKVNDGIILWCVANINNQPEFIPEKRGAFYPGPRLDSRLRGNDRKI